jgi:GAF domain-containing protein
VLGEHLAVSRVLYGEIIDEETCVIHRDHVEGVPSIAGRLRVADFGEETVAAYRRRETLVIEDTETDPRLPGPARSSFRAIGVRANVSLGLVKGGRWVAVFGAHHRSPRHWTPAEVELIEETAERTWAEVERGRAEEALRASEEKYRALFDSIKAGSRKRR